MKVAIGVSLQTSRSWMPRDYASLLRWHETGLSPITIATGVSAWGDLSGTANHYIQATGTKQPLVAANAIATNKSAILFDGVDDTMQASSNIATPRTRYSVLKWISVTGTLVDGAGNRGRIFRNGAAVTSYHSGTSEDDDNASTPTAWHVYTFILAGAASLCRCDGVQIGTFANSFAGSDKAVIGTFGDGVSDPANGYVAADLEYGAVHSALQMQQVEHYLRRRFSL